MPDVITCPGCGRKLRATEDLAGALVACPSCRTTFVAAVGDFRSPSPPPAPSIDPRAADRPQPVRPPHGDAGRRLTGIPAVPRLTIDEEDEDAPRAAAGPPERNPPLCPPDEVPAWKRVRRGLTWMLVAMLAPVGVWALSLVLLFYLITEPEPEVPGAFRATASSPLSGSLVTGALMGAPLILHVVAALVGQTACTAVPRRAGARRLAILGLTLYSVSLALFLARFGLTVLFGLMNSYVTPPPLLYGAWALTILGALFAAARWYVWISFLRTVARLAAAPVLARTLSNLLITAEIAGILFLISAALLNFPRVLLRGSSPLPPTFDVLEPLGGCLGCVTTLVFLVAGIWTVVSMFRVRDAIAAYIAGSG